MAATDEQMRTELEKAGADLRFVWDEADVPLKYQYATVIAGYKSLRMFVSVGTTTAEAKDWLRQEWSLDALVAADRLTMAKGICSWEVARIQMGKEVTMRAEMKANGQTLLVSTQDRIAMRRAV